MTRTRKIAATATTALMLVAAVGWLAAPRATHEDVLKPTHGVSR
jgi:hypothetical protein